MNRHDLIVFTLVLLLGCACSHAVVASTIELRTRTRSGNQEIEKKLTVNPEKVGIVAIDLWDYHWCMTSTHRIESLVPRANATLAAARKLGMKVFWAPTEEDYFVSGTTEMYSLYKENELELLIFIGCHTNICLIGKPPSLKFM
jgi:hypothetical protein